MNSRTFLAGLVALVVLGCGEETACETFDGALLHLSGEFGLGPGESVTAYLAGTVDDEPAFDCTLTTTVDEDGHASIAGGCEGAAELRLSEARDQASLFLAAPFRKLRIVKTWDDGDPDHEAGCGASIDDDDYCSGELVERPLGC